MTRPERLKNTSLRLADVELAVKKVREKAYAESGVNPID